MEKPKIKTIGPKKLIGYNTKTSVADSKAKLVWSQLMPRREEITNQIESDLFSVQVYETGLQMSDFNDNTLFTTWAAVEVSDYTSIPNEMQTLVLKGGLYAVFIHKGGPATFHNTANYIFREWLPKSDYELDDRAHFEVLGKKFLGVDHPDSEEDVWIPIRKR